MAYELTLNYPVSTPSLGEEPQFLAMLASQRLDMAYSLRHEQKECVDQGAHETAIENLLGDVDSILTAIRKTPPDGEVKFNQRENLSMQKILECSDLLSIALVAKEENPDRFDTESLSELAETIHRALKDLSSGERVADEAESEQDCDDECDCPKCVSLDDDMNMLSGNFHEAVGEEGIRGLRLASCAHHEEFSSVLRAFIESHPVTEGGSIHELS